ncbi:GTP cyclohydrolase I FolE [Bradyrhizobium sp. AUGA SZCCT0176]|uniref:GTP cyclohydrolase I FolE n=1 Tax=Bradyrhizobium sp. AUGA SZCCT0176 TaxID=2807664 RepID=UPI001BA836CA|nr:GTP cyclohydrolase I FolE [Bradyrhizobium sp. AUGA SZCCT0176]MBR1225108.1 GTP cyclohydrolase I FolE [Bradyrhizobium sp. AUGA SZCCT0176]
MTQFYSVAVEKSQSQASVKPLPDARERIAEAVRNILLAIGESPDREGLRDTPARVAKMYLEVLGGLYDDPGVHLKTQFTADQHEHIVIVRDISFFSMCEHHLLPFHGKAHVAYLPEGGRLTGLSKIARVVQTLARRPQLQERLSSQIANTIWDSLAPRGVLVRVEADHMCMAMRGVRSPDSRTITVVSRGVLEADDGLRAETLRLLRD